MSSRYRIPEGWALLIECAIGILFVIIAFRIFPPHVTVDNMPSNLAVAVTAAPTNTPTATAGPTATPAINDYESLMDGYKQTAATLGKGAEKSLKTKLLQQVNTTLSAANADTNLQPLQKSELQRKALEIEALITEPPATATPTAAPTATAAASAPNIPAGGGVTINIDQMLQLKAFWGEALKDAFSHITIINCMKDTCPKPCPPGQLCVINDP